MGKNAGWCTGTGGITSRQAIGEQTEQLACQHLQRHGLRLIDKNYRCRLGEIDLIMQDVDSLVFVEVRYRRSAYFGSAEATVDLRKQKKLVKTAMYYLMWHKVSERTPCRFDVVAINSCVGCVSEISWIKDAFHYI